MRGCNIKDSIRVHSTKMASYNLYYWDWKYFVIKTPIFLVQSQIYDIDTKGQLTLTVYKYKLSTYIYYNSIYLLMSLIQGVAKAIFIAIKLKGGDSGGKKTLNRFFLKEIHFLSKKFTCSVFRRST